jgi:hypothetical protein
MATTSDVFLIFAVEKKYDEPGHSKEQPSSTTSYPSGSYSGKGRYERKDCDSGFCRQHLAHSPHSFPLAFIQGQEFESVVQSMPVAHDGSHFQRMRTQR